MAHARADRGGGIGGLEGGFDQPVEMEVFGPIDLMLETAERCQGYDRFEIGVPGGLVPVAVVRLREELAESGELPGGRTAPSLALPLAVGILAPPPRRSYAPAEG